MLSALSRSSEELEKSKHYKEKQSKRDGNKTQESVAWQQLHCAEYTYQIVFIFVNYLPSLKRSGPQFGRESHQFYS